jgi:hypothetical protein
MTVLYIAIVLLAATVLLLASALFHFSRKCNYFSGKEKDFITFVIDIFEQYGDDLGVQSKEQHKKLVEELEKIKKKLLKTS